MTFEALPRQSFFISIDLSIINNNLITRENNDNTTRKADCTCR